MNGLGLQNSHVLLYSSLIMAQNLQSLYSLGNFNFCATMDIALQVLVIISIGRLWLPNLQNWLNTLTGGLNRLLTPANVDSQSPELEIDTPTEETSPFLPPTTVQNLISTEVLVSGRFTHCQPSFEAKQHNTDPAPVKNNHTTYDEKLNSQRFYLFPIVDPTHYRTPKASSVDYLQNETLVHPFEERTNTLVT